MGKFQETGSRRELTCCKLGALVLIVSQMLMRITSGTPVPAPILPDNCTSEEGCCMPQPYTGKPARDFEGDLALPIRIRRPVHKLNESEIARLERGYKLLRELPDLDPRSLSNQANLHCLYCDNGIYYNNMTWPLEIHNHWLFLPWHRMFLYFHERILAKLLDDDTFALPYWNWDNQSSSEEANILPRIYSTNETSYLRDLNRNKCAQPPNLVHLNSIGGCTDKTADELRIENTQVMYTQIVTGAPTPRLFFGEPYSYGDSGGYGPGTFEDNPHGTVHYDENADQVIVNLSQIINTPLLRYEYEESPTAWVSRGQKPGHEKNVTACNPLSPSQTNAMIYTTPELAAAGTLDAKPLTFRVTRPERSDVGVEVLEIQGIKVDNTLQSHWGAYLFFPSAELNTSVSCPEFFGTFNFSPHVGQAQVTRDLVWRVGIRQKLIDLGKDDYDDIVVTLVRFGPSIQQLQLGGTQVLYDTSPTTLD